MSFISAGMNQEMFIHWAYLRIKLMMVMRSLEYGGKQEVEFRSGQRPFKLFRVQDKFYVLDATSNNVRFSIDTDGTVEIPELLKAKGNLATRIRTITTNTTIDEHDHTILIDASGGPVTVTLPTSASSFYAGYGITYTFIRVSTDQEIQSPSRLRAAIILTVTLQLI